jgi:two-component system cell cycle sensor histidine kinase/response regulator CckA
MTVPSGEEIPARLQRSRAVEMLARSFAHEFNNILGCVLGPAQLMAASSKDPQLHQRLSQITQSVQRGIALTAQLSSLGTDPAGARPLDVHACLERLITGAPPGSVEFAAQAGRARVLGDADMIEQALGILVRALAGSQGTVVITTTNVPSANPRATEVFGRPDAWIQVLLHCQERALSARERALLGDPLTVSSADLDSLVFGGAVAALRHSRGRLLADPGDPVRLRVFLPTMDG